ncbi:hypothetical protein PIB30_008654 [Stylosanthes scabra]|uniref:Uncharacterized protein n=1 Tax=Stylosanthes scabra TaxID=79078 RepID=A0ABU6S4H6_9FABA|nr:hypothetical protein [Stylosanthes scabra]
MMAIKLLIVFVLNLILFFPSSLPQRVASVEGNEFRTYIVHVKKPEIWLASEGNNNNYYNLHRWYESFLPSTTITDTATLNTETRILHAYRHVGYAFAARLTKDEALDMANKDGVLMVREENTLQLQTTHTPTFLGLHRDEGLWREPNLGKGVIIGVFDTGISPFHPSFNDEGMLPPPAKWKGKCHFRKGCNNKIIGAISTSRSTYMSAAEPEAPFDDAGHGTHAASTIAGNFVKHANVLGHANGTSAGMAPHAHLAIYRVCSMDGRCSEGSVLAAFDAAIEDGVDIISVSLAGESKFFSEDAMSIGSFVATQKGILVTIAAGNEGPEPSTVVNEAPWMFTVGASTMDRRIVASAKLGNGAEYDGESLFNEPWNNSMLPLGHLHGAPCNNKFLLESMKVEGKIVVCVNDKNTPIYQQGLAVKSAGAAAMILANSNTIGYTLSLSSVDNNPLPVTHVSHASGLQIMRYIDSSTDPKATILFKGTVTGNTPAPVVASFSSRGPSKQCPGILKPDIIAPGVNVLASWPADWGTNNINGEGEGEPASFSIMSGTSMACPHISGVAALLKSSHPDWSPAAVKSAIMTTAHTTNLQGEPIPDEKLLPASLFAIGAGHVNPSKANDPGLVYDTTLDDYTAYLCGFGSTNRMIELVKDKTMNYCEQVMKKIEATELNYPSFSVVMGSDSFLPKTYNRTVRNVGPADSRYVVRVVPPSGVDVSVEPQILVFNGEQQTARYSVTFTRKRGDTLIASSTAQGFLEWFSDNNHFVTSPIAVIFSR